MPVILLLVSEVFMFYKKARTPDVKMLWCHGEHVGGSAFGTHSGKGDVHVQVPGAGVAE